MGKKTGAAKHLFAAPFVFYMLRCMKLFHIPHSDPFQTDSRILFQLMLTHFTMPESGSFFTTIVIMPIPQFVWRGVPK